MKPKFIARDISWLSFNARVLQEADDPKTALADRIRFLGIFSNNLDEFFRVRVATLKRMVEFTDKKNLLNLDYIDNPQIVLDEIQRIVLKQQGEFSRIWTKINKELVQNKIILINDKKLNAEQKEFVKQYFEDVVRPYIIPLMIENLPELPYLRDKSLYLAIAMKNRNSAYQQKFSLIEIPSKSVGRFVILPSKPGFTNIILLEDLIEFNLPIIFSHFKFNQFEAHVFKITKDAELDFRHFMDFPNVIPQTVARPKPFQHPLIKKRVQVADMILKQDVLLHFPYHSYDPVIDMLREAAMDDDVYSIKITAYRLAANSKVINALINAARNGKQVIVFLELKARFDEEANLKWKSIMEEEGVVVLVGVPNKKVHAKVCIIQKKVNNKTIKYGFISTGNLNEKTAKIYADHCLLTSNRLLMNEVSKIFDYLLHWQMGDKPIAKMKHLLVSPINMRASLIELIENEIKFAKKGKPAKIIIKLNSLSDLTLLENLYKASKQGVEVHLIIRGIFTLKKANAQLNAISIVDQYLEHARVMIFQNNGNEKVYLSSADWMVRNLDHRIEVATPIYDKKLKQELIDIINIQLKDNQKARILDAELLNKHVPLVGRKTVRSQEETYQFLINKKY